MDKCWLTCESCRKTIPFALQGRCECGGTLLVEYDLAQVEGKKTRELWKNRPFTMWRYLELLPQTQPDRIVSLGEGGTPLLRLDRLEQKLGVRGVWVKREEQNPTGSFKARGFASAISLLHERGYRAVAVNSNGNAASAMSAYAARAGMKAVVIVPRDCPGIIVEECARYGAELYLVDGYIHDAGRIVAEGMAEQGWFHAGTLREPGRVEGKKTMGLELAEQFGWQLPDVIVYPTGGGSGIIGLWKAFRELEQLGWIRGPLPRLVSVQEEGCQPIVDAFASGRPVQGNDGQVPTLPTGLRVPNPPDGNLIVSILRKTGGTALAVSKEDIRDAARRMGRQGVSSSPEGAATLAGLLRLRQEGWVGKQDRVVLFNTSHADKYVDYTSTLRLPVIRTYADLLKWREQWGEA